MQDPTTGGAIAAADATVCVVIPASTSEACNVDAPECTREVSWQVGTLSDCSVSCGGGIATWPLTCTEKDAATGVFVAVADAKCDGLEKPDTQFPCNAQACPVWVSPAFPDCSCGQRTVTRTVQCKAGNVLSVACLAADQPATVQECAYQACVDPVWAPAAYSVCSATCAAIGADKPTRTHGVSCVDRASGDAGLADSLCTAAAKPFTTRDCNTNACPVYYNLPGDLRNVGAKIESHNLQSTKRVGVG